MGASRRVDAYLDGISLTQAVPTAIIRQITEEAPQVEQVTAAISGASGERILSAQRRWRRVTVEFVLRDIHHLDNRALELEAACAWARDGYLSVSYRPDRRLYVRCTGRPSLGAARDYTQVYKVELTSPLPWWEGQEPTLWTASGAEVEKSFYPPGTAPELPVALTVTPTGGRLTDCAIVCGAGGALNLSGLGLAAGQALRIDHSAEGFLTIQSGGADRSACLSLDSADDLAMQPGVANPFHFTANTACDIRIEARGRYL